MTTESTHDKGKGELLESCAGSADILPEDRASAGRRAFKQKALLVALSFILPGILVTAYFSGLGPVRQGILADSDCYLRLVRVRELYRHGQWYDATIERANVPYGGKDIVHWTRPLDALLLVGAVPLALVMDFERALFLWGVVLSPILFAATFLALIWSSRPLLDRGGPFLAALLFPSSLAVLAYYCAARPDHHSLLLLLFVLFLGFVLRLIDRPLSIAACVGAAAVGALSLWVSVESLLMIGIAITMLAILWARRNGAFLIRNLYFNLSLFALTCGALVIERPWGNLFAVEFDRISVVHCCLFGLVTLFWAGVFLLRSRPAILGHSTGRLVILVLGAVASAGIVWALFPGFYGGPLANADPRATSLWLRYNGELHPLLSSNDPSCIPLIGSVILCLPFLVLWTTRSDRRAMWAYISLSIAVFTVLALRSMRWTAYPQAVIVLPLAQLVIQVWMWMDRRLRGNAKALLKGLFGAACFSLLIFSHVPAARASNLRGTGTSDGPREVSPQPICEHLENSERWQNRRLRIVAHISWGPEILYRTRHSVVGTGCHRDTRGILDAYGILTAEKDEDAFRLIQERGIDTIVLCPNSTEGHLYIQANASTFYRRLCDGHLPPWCREVVLPDSLAASFKLFEINER